MGSLPYHFGDTEGLRQCYAAVREQDGLVAEANGAVVGFLTVVRAFPASAEITWMAVHAEHRRRRIGHQLVEAVVEDLRTEGRSLLVVSTLAEVSSHDDPADGYGATRAFYRQLGFIDAWMPHGYWSERQQALLLVRHLGETQRTLPVT